MAVQTFAVSSVERATRALKEKRYWREVEGFLTRAAGENPDSLRAAIRNVWDSWGRYSGGSEATTARREIVACSRYHGRLVAGVSVHPLLEALHRAFQDHRPVCLSPDMIWLTICQGVAQHVKMHTEELRSKLVAHRGQIELTVRRDDFVLGSPENPWEEVIEDMAEQVRGHVGGFAEAFEPDFSTTGPVERTVANVCLLDSLRNVFSYRTASKCGIPEITLEGTTADWQSLVERTSAFAGLGLEAWFATLKPILEEFVRASRGEASPSFWRSIYKYQEASGGSYVTGWIVALFPYLEEYDGVQRNVWLEEEEGRQNSTMSASSRGLGGGPVISAFPSGLSTAPFVWDYFGDHLEMEWIAGFVGIWQDPATLALRPEIGWAVRPGVGMSMEP